MVKTAQPAAAMVGQWFHSLHEDGRIHWQGQIVGDPAPGLYLVQLFSWMSGDPTTRHLVRLEDMTSWLFYRTHDEFLYSSEHGEAHRRSSGMERGTLDHKG